MGILPVCPLLIFPIGLSSRSEGLNQKPKDYNQEVPRKLRNLGFTIGGVREGRVGKKSKNKFHKHPDGEVYHMFVYSLLSILCRWNTFERFL